MSDADPPKPVDLSKLVHIDFTTIADPDPTEQAQEAARPGISTWRTRAMSAQDESRSQKVGQAVR